MNQQRRGRHRGSSCGRTRWSLSRIELFWVNRFFYIDGHIVRRFVYMRTYLLVAFPSASTGQSEVLSQKIYILRIKESRTRLAQLINLARMAWNLDATMLGRNLFHPGSIWIVPIPMVTYY